MSAFQEDYVAEILAAARAGMTADQFKAFCQPDINAGFRAEAEEAQRRYFAKPSTPAVVAAPRTL